MSHEADSDPALAEVKVAVEAAWDEGCPVAGGAHEIALLAIRRWRFSGRRGIHEGDKEARMRDLVKGLIEGLESNPKLVGPLERDYEYLAGRIADVF